MRNLEIVGEEIWKMIAKDDISIKQEISEDADSSLFRYVTYSHTPNCVYTDELLLNVCITIACVCLLYMCYLR